MIKYVQIYFDFLDSIEPLDDAERGRLFTAILQYASTGELPDLTGNERFAFPTAKGQIDRDQAQYNKTCLARSDSGRKGGLAKGSKSKQKVAKGSKFSQDKDKDKDKDKDNTPSEYIGHESAFEIAMSEFKQFRKDIKAPLNDLSEKKIRNELDRLSEGNEAIKIQIIDQSIRNNWKGVFALKDKPKRNYDEHPASDLDHLLVNLDE